MTKLEMAQAYVEAKDYLFDENREIAGNGYLAALESEYVHGLERVVRLAKELARNESGRDGMAWIRLASAINRLDAL